jgi:aminopeptidase N
MWRKEGFATYIQIMWETRADPEELDIQMTTMRSVVEGNDKHYPINNPPPEYLFELNVYFEGALVIHALRQEIGDQAFFDGVREYIGRYGGKTASDADFQAVMAEAAGRPLDAFFSSWFPSE